MTWRPLWRPCRARGSFNPRCCPQPQPQLQLQPQPQLQIQPQPLQAQAQPFTSSKEQLNGVDGVTDSQDDGSDYTTVVGGFLPEQFSLGSYSAQQSSPFPAVLDTLRSPPHGSRLSPAFDRFLRPALLALSEPAPSPSQTIPGATGPRSLAQQQDSSVLLDLRDVMGGEDAASKEAEASDRRAQIVESLVASIRALDLADPNASKMFIDAIIQQRRDEGDREA